MTYFAYLDEFRDVGSCVVLNHLKYFVAAGARHTVIDR